MDVLVAVGVRGALAIEGLLLAMAAHFAFIDFFPRLSSYFASIVNTTRIISPYLDDLADPFQFWQSSF